MISTAMRSGPPVMLENLPGINITEVIDLSDRARSRGNLLFAARHSWETAAVRDARSWLSRREVTAVRVSRLKDVKGWYPGQQWIWQVSGIGVFDASINALSMLTHRLPEAIHVTAAKLWFPSDCEALLCANRAQARQGKFRFSHPGSPRWDIDVDTTDGSLSLIGSGSTLTIDHATAAVLESTECANLYRHSAAKIKTSTSDVEVSASHLIADAFLCGQRVEIEPFNDGR